MSTLSAPNLLSQHLCGAHTSITKGGPNYQAFVVPMIADQCVHGAAIVLRNTNRTTCWLCIDGVHVIEPGCLPLNLECFS